MSVLFILVFVIVALVSIVVFIEAIVYMIKQIGKSGVMDDLNSHIKKSGESISEKISDFTSIPVEKCPNCGANIDDTHQKKCQYCGGVLPRKSRFKKEDK